jgi:uncharacterized membrane protein YjjP (DUF1212 family)
VSVIEEPQISGRPSLEEIAMLSMEFGRLLMEAGGSARLVEEIVHNVARGLGAERVDLRIGYASLAVTVGIRGEGITRMRKVGSLGVNQRLSFQLRELATAVQRAEVTPSAARSQLHALAQSCPRHPGWLVDVAVGIACASFGRLLGVDWVAIGPVFLGAALGQRCRRLASGASMNVFISATMVSFIASALAGLGARLLDSHTVDTAMIAAVLLLIPGLPSLNAQNDILEGRPTLGSARAVWVLVMIVFMTVGLWLSQTMLGRVSLVGTGSSSGTPMAGVSYLLHQALFGGVAAVGFGVLFNMGSNSLALCGVSGALALAIRTAGLGLGWTLEGASFTAALAIGSGVLLLQKRAGVSRNAIAVSGCIPMVPGGFAAKAILGLFAVTHPAVQHADQILIGSVQDALRVVLTVGAMGTGLAIPSMLLRVRRLA